MAGLNLSACSCPRAECFENVLSFCLGQFKTSWNSETDVASELEAHFSSFFTAQKQAGVDRNAT